MFILRSGQVLPYIGNMTNSLSAQRYCQGQYPAQVRNILFLSYICKSFMLVRSRLSYWVGMLGVGGKVMMISVGLRLSYWVMIRIGVRL